MLTLVDRLKNYCTQKNIPQDHIDWYVANLQSAAIENNALITDEMIHNQVNAQELFYGLGSALANYMNVEKQDV